LFFLAWRSTLNAQAEIPWEFPIYLNSQGTKYIVGYHDFICVHLRSSAVKMNWMLDRGPA
jgi:hypothetical protein